MNCIKYKKYLYKNEIILNRANEIVENCDNFNRTLIQFVTFNDKIKEIVEKDLTLLEELSGNKMLDETFLEKHIKNKNWNWRELSLYISMEFLEKHLTDLNCKWNWNWDEISKHVSMEFLEKHLTDLNCKWNWDEIGKHVSMEFLEKHLDTIEDCNTICKWNWDTISLYVSMEFLEKHLNNKICKWNWDNISLRVSMEFLEKNLTNIICKWNWLYISNHVSIEFLEKNLDNKICKWKRVFIIKNVGIKFLIENLNNPNNELDNKWKLISDHFGMNLLEKNSGKLVSSKIPGNNSWYSDYINNFVSMDILEKNLYDYSWDWYILSKRVSMEFLEKHIVAIKDCKPEGKWDFTQLIKNVNIDLKKLNVLFPDIKNYYSEVERVNLFSINLDNYKHLFKFSSNEFKEDISRNHLLKHKMIREMKQFILSPNHKFAMNERVINWELKVAELDN